MVTKITNFVDLLRFRASTQSDRTAFIFLQNGETEASRFTYKDLDLQAQLIAISLRNLTNPGDRALILYPSGIEFVAAFFGCLYAGVIAVPAYPPRPNQKLSRLQAIISDSQAKVTLTTESLLSQISQHFASEPELSQMQFLATDNLPNSSILNWTEPAINPDSLAFLQYTSGSTGTPKGVMVSHEI